MIRNDIVLDDRFKKMLNFKIDRFDCNKYDIAYENIEYRCNPSRCLDIYLPGNNDTYPVFLLVYGGGWVSGHKRSVFIEPMLYLLKKGFACVLIDYSLAIDYVFPQAVIDIKEALHFIKKEGNKYHLDSDEIHVWGESAGAHLALLSGLSLNSEFGLIDDVDIKSICAFYPMIDFQLTKEDAKFHQNSRMDLSDRYSVFGQWLADKYDDENTRRLANPISFIDHCHCKLWLQHGTKDTLVSYRQSQYFYDKCINKDIYFELVDGKQHCDDYFFSKDNIDKMVDFIRSENEK